MLKRLGCALIVFIVIAGCATQQRYYLASNLNQVSVGQTKSELFRMFPGEKRAGGAPPLVIRAAQQDDGGLIEVGEVVLTDQIRPAVPYWFLFNDGILQQWGRPEDWQNVKARYEINYNPSYGVAR